jgi:hypothetical protein
VIRKCRLLREPLLIDLARPAPDNLCRDYTPNSTRCLNTLHIAVRLGPPHGPGTVDLREEITTQDRYKEYWAYLRHVETLRFAMGSLILTAVSALLAAVYLAPEGGVAEDLRPQILIFLSLFVGIASWFLVSHKRSYDHYFKMVRRLDPPVPDFKKRGAFEALLALVTLPQLAIGASTFAFDSWSRWEIVFVPIIAATSAVLPWIYHLCGKDVAEIPASRSCTDADTLEDD